MATLIPWSDEFSIGIQEIDEQHRRLVELMNRLYTALAAKHNSEAVERVLDEVIEYTRVHFAVEECLMRLFAYPDYDAHKDIHDKLVERVTRFYEQYASGNHAVGMDLLLFLKEWLFHHISKVDRHYGPHLTKHGVKKEWIRKFW